MRTGVRPARGRLRVGMVGHPAAGAAHARAWRAVNRDLDLPLRAELTAVCGTGPAGGAAAHRLGGAGRYADWRDLVARDDIDLIDICAPGRDHAGIAIAALDAGKHVLCGKPLANTLAEAEAMAGAAARAHRHGVRAMCGSGYRRVPAVALLRDLVAAGRLGTVRRVRAAYRTDEPGWWPPVGSGSDLGAHVVDLAQYVTGRRVTGVTAVTGPSAPGTRRGWTTVDDAALVVGRLDGGGLASFEAGPAAGRRNALRIEVDGDRGSLAFDRDRPDELVLRETRGRTVLRTGPRRAPDAGHTVTHQLRDLIAAIGAGTDPGPSFTEALGVQLVLDAAERSAANGAGWTTVHHPGERVRPPAVAGPAGTPRH
ncbi:Gfo/Idh/MocA family oxidoreductase [Longispora sp. NPDC051575]|uniref:Gfo/Idh/MocA family protein n=1 Tax=Longispora sp. NPDC051575 TaxID=3154943 RepID=UPI003442EAAF